MPFIVSPLVKWTLSALGAVAAVHWAVREFRRVNAELDELNAARVRQSARPEELPRLRRDPRTGEYRL
jgi:hypothetical protein